MEKQVLYNDRQLDPKPKALKNLQFDFRFHHEATNAGGSFEAVDISAAALSRAAARAEGRRTGNMVVGFWGA